MSFAIIRTAKYKTGQHIRAMANHNFRVVGADKDDSELKFDPLKSHLNVYIGAQNPDEEMAAIRSRIATCTKKPRPDANRVMELLMTSGPEFFEGKGDDFAKKYLNDCLEFANQKFGPENVVSAQMHFDEKTPHLHVKVVPLETSVRKTKHTTTTHTVLNAKSYTNGHEKMVEFQDEFYAFIKERGYDLERGISKKVTGARHKKLAVWYAEQDQLLDAKKEVIEGQALTLIASKKENAAILQKANEMNNETRLKEAELVKREAAIEIAEVEKAKKYQEAAKKLNDAIQANNMRADKVKALYQQSQELKAIIDDPDTLTVLQRMKSSDQAKDIIVNVTRMDESALTMLRPLSDEFANANQGLRPVDRTQEDWSAVLDAQPLYSSSDDYSRSMR